MMHKLLVVGQFFLLWSVLFLGIMLMIYLWGLVSTGFDWKEIFNRPTDTKGKKAQGEIVFAAWVIALIIAILMNL